MFSLEEKKKKKLLKTHNKNFWGKKGEVYSKLKFKNNKNSRNSPLLNKIFVGAVSRKKTNFRSRFFTTSISH